MKSSWTVVRSPWRGLTWLVGGIVALIAAVFAVVLAIGFFLFAVLTAVTLTVTGTLRRSVRRGAADRDLIEARQIGGHSWVAYGWDGRR